jgi:cytidyltransferase-like protein
LEEETCLQPLPVVTALTYGTFDGFHLGHLRLLHRAADYGDRLVVGVISDEV